MNPNVTPPSQSAPALPLVISIGFSGSRLLREAPANSSPESCEAFEVALTQKLQAILETLPQELGLPRETASRQHFFCGISQLAIGADQCFTRACAALGIPQRLFLPLPWDAYRMAASSNGTPDFTSEQRNTADDLLKSPHIIQQRIISLTDDRRARLEDVNLEIVNVANVIICLKRKGAAAKPGGTQHMINLAAKRDRPVPVLELTLSEANGQPVLEAQWLVGKKTMPKLKPGDFLPPPLPHEIASIETLAGHGQPPNVSDYTERLKSYGSAQSKKHSAWFKYGAVVIIATHLLATVAAVIALKLETDVVKLILGFELAFLLAGFSMHFWLHRTHAVRHWAFCRLVAEVARSVRSIGKRHVYLDYLFNLPLPHNLLALLRTLNVLHLRDTRHLPQQPWEPMRDAYVRTRLLHEPENSGHQIPYYRREAARAQSWNSLALGVFNICSASAFLVSLTKLLVKCHCPILDNLPYHETQSLCGALAVILPVLAVGALSLAGASDLEARTYTFKDMHEFLKEQKKRLEEATSEREFDRLMLETESRLLGETVIWFSRRSFTNIA